MELQKICIALLALMLAAMVIVPCVSAEISFAPSEMIVKIENNAISEETARIHAEYSLAEFIGLDALGDSQTWSGAVVNPKPLEIYDLNGEKLCYLFNIEKDKNKIGEIRIAASKVIGSSVLTIGPQKNAIDQKNLEQDLQSVMENEKVGKKSKSRLVSYAFPKIGLMSQITDESDTIVKTVIVDAYDHTIITDDNLIEDGNSKVYSVYNKLELTTFLESIKKWDNYDSTIHSVLNENPDIAGMAEKSLTGDQILTLSRSILNSRAVMEYEVVSGVPLYSQPNSVWCAVTTARMISEKYGVYRSITDIALKMNAYSGGQPAMTEPEDELVYYHATVASGGLGKPSSDVYNLISWDTVKNEIDNDRPFKVGDDGHARAATGYLRSPSSPYYTYVYFKDPAPEGQGSEYWQWFNELNPFFYDDYIQII